MAQKKFMAICIIFVVAVTCLGAKGAVAQDAAEGKVLRVAVKPIAPFVFKHETELSGFSTSGSSGRRCMQDGRRGRRRRSAKARRPSRPLLPPSRSRSQPSW